MISLEKCNFKEDYTKKYNPETVGTPEEQAKALHHYLDWIKAVCKRSDDNRMHTKEWTLQLLLKIQTGMPLDNEIGWPTHYTGD